MGTANPWEPCPACRTLPTPGRPALWASQGLRLPCAPSFPPFITLVVSAWALWEVLLSIIIIFKNIYVLDFIEKE